MKNVNMLYPETHHIHTLKKFLISRFQNVIKATFWKWYILLCLLYIAFLSIDHFFILSKEVYINSHGGDSLDVEKLTNLLVDFNNGFWADMAVIPILMLFQALIISFWLYMGLVLREIQFSYVLMLNEVTKSLIIFPIVSIIMAIVLIFTKKIETLKDTHKPDWHSLMFFFDKGEIPKWLIYPLRTINIAEILFLIILLYLLKYHTKKTIAPTIVVTYILGLCFWVIFVIFGQITGAGK